MHPRGRGKERERYFGWVSGGHSHLIPTVLQRVSGDTCNTILQSVFGDTCNRFLDCQAEGLMPSIPRNESKGRKDTRGVEEAEKILKKHLTHRKPFCSNHKVGQERFK